MLIGGMVGEHGNRLRRECRVGLLGEGKQCLTGDLQVLDVLVEFPQAGGQFVGLGTP